MSQASGGAAFMDFVCAWLELDDQAREKMLKGMENPTPAALSLMDALVGGKEPQDAP